MKPLPEAVFVLVFLTCITVAGIIASYEAMRQYRKEWERQYGQPGPASQRAARKPVLRLVRDGEPAEVVLAAWRRQQIDAGRIPATFCPGQRGPAEHAKDETIS